MLYIIYYYILLYYYIIIIIVEGEGVCENFLKIPNPRPCKCNECRGKVLPQQSVISRIGSFLSNTFTTVAGLLWANPNPNPPQAHQTFNEQICKKSKDVLCHKVLKCKTCKTVWQRDVNAALNMHHIVQETINGHPRPPYLCRPKTQRGG